jgi:hypothetical protein
MNGQFARRVDAAAFGLVMLAFCWWLHLATQGVGWLMRSQRGAPLPLLAVEAVAVLLVVLGCRCWSGRWRSGSSAPPCPAPSADRSPRCS